MLTAPILLIWWLGSLAGNSPAALLAFLRKEIAGKSILSRHFSPRVFGLLCDGPSAPSVPSDGWWFGRCWFRDWCWTWSPFAAVHVLCQAGVLGWLQSFPHLCLAGTSRRTSREVRLSLYLAAWSIAPCMQLLLFSKTSICKGTKSLQFKLAQHAIFSLLPKSRIVCRLCLSTPVSLFSLMPVLGAMFFHRPSRSRTWFICTSGSLLFAVSLSEQQSFNEATLCKIYKNSLSCRSWRNNENVDSPLEPPQSINNYQERIID